MQQKGSTSLDRTCEQSRAFMPGSGDGRRAVKTLSLGQQHQLHVDDRGVSSLEAERNKSCMLAAVLQKSSLHETIAMTGCEHP